MNENKNLWSRLKQGDTIALGTLYERYADMLYVYGMKIAQNSELIKDCVEDLFVYLYDKREKLSVPENTKAYLLVSLKRRVYQALMDLSKEHSQFVNIDIANMDGRCRFDLTIDMHETMEHNEFQDDQLRVLQEVLDNLSPRAREILYLRYYKQLSLDEVVEITGTTKQNVKNITSRTLIKLRQNELLTKAFLLALATFYESLTNVLKG